MGRESVARQKSGKRSWLPTIVAGVVVLGVIGSLFGGGEEDQAAPEEPQTQIEETVQPETVPEPEEPPAPEETPEPEEEPAAQPAPEETPAQPEPEAPAEAAAEKPKSRTVYVTKSGKRYHYDSHCNGATYYESDLDTALAQGLSPCKKCVG